MMLPSMTLLSPDPLAVLLLALVTAQRLYELTVARRNTAALLAQGAAEHAPGHYPLIVLLHGAWLAGLWLLAGGIRPDSGLVLVYLLIQGLRIWTLVTLGPRWTTRIIVIAGERLVAAGPYRFLRHPNYVVVAAEIAILPLCFGLAGYAVVFSLLNAIMLSIRIRAENAALALAEREG
jgi:methyltransferase